MQEAGTKKYRSEPVQDRSFVYHLSLVRQKRPLLVFTPPSGSMERIAICLFTSSSQWKHSSHVSLLWDAQLSASVPSLSLSCQAANWTARYSDAYVLGEGGGLLSNRTK